ncbi:hypothetical protein HanIR_Chr06g0270191 [Helianthus annuus]|nr:hypothetical protein HanIR_Chr06g0270191 [Helianthus annuus]
MGINLVKMQLFMSGRILLLPKRHRNKVFKNTKALLQGLTTTTIWTPSPNQLDNLSYDLPLDFDPIFFSGGLDDMGQENDLPSQMPGYYPTISS